MLLNLFAPSLAHAVSALRGDVLRFEICSVNSVKPSGKGGPSPADSGLHTMKHCVFCATHAGALAPPPAASSGALVLDGHERFPALYYRSPAPLFSWTVAKPRGPPSPA